MSDQTIFKRRQDGVKVVQTILKTKSVKYFYILRGHDYTDDNSICYFPHFLQRTLSCFEADGNVCSSAGLWS